MEKSINEKRVFVRVKTTLPIRISGLQSSESIHGETINLSQNGACVLIDHNLPDATPFTLSIDLPPCYTSDPDKAEGINMLARVIWRRAYAKGRKNIYGLKITNIRDSYLLILMETVKSEATRSLLVIPPEYYPKFKFIRVPHACNMYAIDLTIGCEHDCLYCHFSKLNQEEWQKKYPNLTTFPIPIDISPMYKMTEFPKSVVYLSPSSDPFAPKARNLTHEMLDYLLPKGIIFTISTKEMIPDQTLRLLKKFNSLIEGLAIGITTLDEKRNKLIEPSCPTAKQRLDNISKLLEIGCRTCVRLDPVFPGIDDTNIALKSTIKAISKTGIKDITGTYLFTYGKFLKHMKQEPILKKSLRLLTEKSYIVGGVALSIPLEMKRIMYKKMDDICKSYGIRFNTCGCKEIRLRDTGYSLVCRNMDYYKKDIG